MYNNIWTVLYNELLLQACCICANYCTSHFEMALPWTSSGYSLAFHNSEMCFLSIQP